VTAVRQAVRQAGLTDSELRDCPVVIGTTLREQRSAELWWRGDAPLAHNDLHFGSVVRELTGSTRCYTFANACAASLYGLAMAMDMIATGQAELAIVAGTDSITESAFGLIDRVQNDTPRALRPFDRSRSGMLMGEGAVAVVVRPSDRASGNALARVRAVGVNCDAHHPTAPDPDGITAVVHDAHRRAGVEAGDIDLVMLHGSGTQLNDIGEATALDAVFRYSGRNPLVTAVKSMTGHTLGGSGLLSLVVAARSLRTGRVPPILGLDDAIDELGVLAPVREPASDRDLRLAQVDAFGFGGINAVALVEGVGR
jgi:3-oxoacyl-(acyl-carrier-protein) synthase